jgi:hypothetical protein
MRNCFLPASHTSPTTQVRNKWYFSLTPGIKTLIIQSGYGRVSRLIAFDLISNHMHTRYSNHQHHNYHRKNH